MEEFIPEYVNTLCQEIKRAGSHKGDEIVHTIYFGGGTPSLLAARFYHDIFDELKKSFHYIDDPEITMEVNPGTVTLNFLKDILDLGVNRLSIGMQSSNAADLRLLGRIHDPWDVIQTVKWAQQAGFSNFSLDLMFGLPGQTLHIWKKSLEFVLRLDPKHLSLYSLTIEPDTPLAIWQVKGLLPQNNEDLSADMYEFAIEFLPKQGFEQYEISNWSLASDGKKTYQSQHNLRYWLNEPYLGFGAGAHSHFNHLRMENILSIPAYINTGKKAGNQDTRFAQRTKQPLDLKTEMQETMMMGLRLTQTGVSQERFLQRFGKAMTDVFHSEITELLGLGLVEWVGVEPKRLLLTHRGILVGNQVFMRFVN